VFADICKTARSAITRTSEGDKETMEKWAILNFQAIILIMRRLNTEWGDTIDTVVAFNIAFCNLMTLFAARVH
jgi:hypothetical protein